METFAMFSRRLLNLSAQEASELCHNVVDSEHLLIAISRQDQSHLVQKILSDSSLDTKEIISQVLKINPRGDHTQNMFTYSDNIKKIFEDSIKISRDLGFESVGLEHVLLGILSNNNLAKYILNKNEIYEGPVQRRIIEEKRELDARRLQNAQEKLAQEQDAIDGQKNAQTKKKELGKYTKDITQEARDNKLDIISAREKELKRIEHILAKRDKNTPLLVGESGVGKTSIVYALAQQIVDGKVSQVLKNSTILLLEMSKLVSGTKYKGELEERIGKIIEEIHQRKDIVLFIDNFQSISIIANQESTAEAGNMLKQLLMDKKTKVIGACSTSDYKRYISRDPTLNRRIQLVGVQEPNKKDAYKMIKGNIITYENYYDLDIPDSTIDAAINHSKRYITNRSLPDSALDVIDESAAAKVVSRNQTYTKIRMLVELSRKIEDEYHAIKDDEPIHIKKDMEQKLDDLAAELATYDQTDIEDYYKNSIITKEDIASMICTITGIPVEKISKSENKKILAIEEELKKEVVGQEKAVGSVSRAIKRSRTGIKDPNKPVGSFIFIGPTGVGKTELAKALARQLFDDENALIRLDMSEYSQQFDATKIIGSPPGYVGHKDGGQLTEQVMRKPYSIILFDEIEKAHPEIFNLLLQILDEGTLTDSKGVKVDFKNTIVIMTSNLGATQIMSKNAIGFSNLSASGDDFDYTTKDQDFKKALKKYFKAEFLNRVDEVISFRQLSKDDVGKIVKLMVQKLQDRLKEKQIQIDIDEKAVQLLAEIGYSEEYGARPLNRAIQVNIEDVLAQKILTEEIKPKDKVQITAKDEKFDFNVEDERMKWQN